MLEAFLKYWLDVMFIGEVSQRFWDCRGCYRSCGCSCIHTSPLMKMIGNCCPIKLIMRLFCFMNWLCLCWLLNGTDGWSTLSFSKNNSVLKLVHIQITVFVKKKSDVVYAMVGQMNTWTCLHVQINSVKMVKGLSNGIVNHLSAHRPSTVPQIWLRSSLLRVFVEFLNSNLNLSLSFAHLFSGLHIHVTRCLFSVDSVSVLCFHGLNSGGWKQKNRALCLWILPQEK